MRTGSTVVLAEAVAAVAALGGGAVWHLAVDALRRRVHRLARLVHVVAVSLQVSFVRFDFLWAGRHGRHACRRCQLGVGYANATCKEQRNQKGADHGLLGTGLASFRIGIALGGPVVSLGLVFCRAVIPGNMCPVFFCIAGDVFACGFCTGPGSLFAGGMVAARCMASGVASSCKYWNAKTKCYDYDKRLFHFIPNFVKYIAICNLEILLAQRLISRRLRAMSRRPVCLSSAIPIHLCKLRCHHYRYRRRNRLLPLMRVIQP